MKCSIQGCAGEYELKRIVHTVTDRSEVLLFEDVPAQVCSVCSDTLLESKTIRHIEQLMRQCLKPRKQAPVYSYA